MGQNGQPKLTAGGRLPLKGDGAAVKATSRFPWALRLAALLGHCGRALWRLGEQDAPRAWSRPPVWHLSPKGDGAPLAPLPRARISGLTLWLNIGPPVAPAACLWDAQRLGLDGAQTLLVCVPSLAQLPIYLAAAQAVPGVCWVLLDARHAEREVAAVGCSPQAVRRMGRSVGRTSAPVVVLGYPWGQIVAQMGET